MEVNKISTNSRDSKEKPRSWWVIRVFIITILLSAVLSLISTELMNGAGYVLATALLIVFIAIGIIFDIIGVAVTAADPRDFHAMAAHKEKGGKEGVWLLNRADKVASICNDIVGDICGIISGSTAAVIIVKLQQDFSPENVLISIGLTALVSGLTIGGKAMGKGFAMRKSTPIVHNVARIISLLVK